MILKATTALSKPFDCSKNGIKRCQGKCCTKHLGSYWPIRAYPMGCPYLTNNGCSLSIHDRPIDCLLYPLFINHKGTLMIHNHCYHKKWMCHPNMELGEPLVDSIGEMLAELFGPITFMEIREGVMYCNGTVFSTTPEFNLQREVEQICIKYDLPIIPRTEIKPVTPILLRDFVKDKPISKHYHEV